jgi:hypothetical protein
MDEQQTGFITDLAKLIVMHDKAIKALEEIKNQKLEDHACMGDMALRMGEIAKEALEAAQ